MRVLGIDPGTVNLGYGLLEGDEESLTARDYGVISASPHLPLEKRLYHLYSELLTLITHCQPSQIAIEEPFMAKNVRSALAMGQAQAVALLAAASQNISVYKYTPNQVKQAVTDYGHSGKEQVQEMVRIQLGMPARPEPSDAADALAVAICHVRQRHLAELLAE